MIKRTRIFITLSLTTLAVAANAQNSATTSSPYSKFGIGDLDPMLTPQNAAMGGISAATNVIGGFSTINTNNPASYGMINITTIDAGLFGSSVKLSRSGQGSQKSSDFRINHILFGFPVTSRSAVTFGLQPYSQTGYQYSQTLPNFGTGDPADTNSVRYTYRGEGGLSKAHIGYGFGIGKHILLGANVAYIFGSLKNYSTAAVPDLYGTFNTRIEDNTSIQGLNYDYGAQLMFNVGSKDRVTFGYSGSLNSKLNIQTNHYVSHFTSDIYGDDNPPLDSIINTEGPKNKLKLPTINRFGFTYKSGERFLFGADYATGSWSDLTVDGQSYDNLKDSKTYSVGMQITPNVNALRSYWALVDYRFGFRYNETYLHVNNTDINQYAVTFGLGLPLRPSENSQAYYKINIGAEIGKRGALTNNLVKENFVNIRLGFTINDRWFTRYRYQ